MAAAVGEVRDAALVGVLAKGLRCHADVLGGLAGAEVLGHDESPYGYVFAISSI